MIVGPDAAVPPEGSPIRVGIALVGRDGRYLIRRRPPGGPMPGVWEFPGGKCEPGESFGAATLRECLEETGMRVVLSNLRCRVSHRYPHGFVELAYHDCAPANTTAEPEPASGFVWVDAALLPTLEFPPANGPILRQLADEAALRSSPPPLREPEAGRGPS